MRIFADRQEAGERLADALERIRFQDAVVVALPRGGVPIGLEVSRRLKCPLDILITRKVGAPENPEFGIGAVSETGLVWLNDSVVRSLGISDLVLRGLIRREQDEIQRRIQLYRNHRKMVPVQDRDVILVDDGLATGVTAKVSIRALRALRARRVFLAAPVGASDTVRMLEREADRVICLEQPPSFYSVGLWYEQFYQVPDEDVIRDLQTAHEALKKPNTNSAGKSLHKEMELSDGQVRLPGTLIIPPQASGLVIFAHGSGSSRKSLRNIEVAQHLNHAGIATLLFDLLNPEESENRRNVFGLELLSDRLTMAFRAMKERPETWALPIGFFGASTGGGAALQAAAQLGSEIAAVVSRGGRPDLALPYLSQVHASTLLIVGGEDQEVIELNRKAHAVLPHSKLLVIAGATHLFEEPGALETVARASSNWFNRLFAERLANNNSQAA